MLKTLIILAGGLVASVGFAEGDSMPPLDFPLEITANCQDNPCDPACTPTCAQYDRTQESCKKENQVLVDWQCSTPCSCLNGKVSCSVSYRCTDDKLAQDTPRPLVKPRIELAVPLSIGLPTR